jgi:SdrD B-like protein
MSQEVGQTELQEKTQRLLDGPLKHIRTAALAAALLPLASVAATPASAQVVSCASGGVCGTVFNDANNNGFQEDGETGIEGVTVFVCQVCDGTDRFKGKTGPEGLYSIMLGGQTVTVLIPTGSQASPPNAGDNDDIDSDGVWNGDRFSVAGLAVNGTLPDFGLFTSAVRQPGTGTPGYWKNHPDAWPVDSITVGGQPYTKEDAIAWLGRVGKDKSTTMFSSLVPAMLNILIHNDGSCVIGAIAAANAWMVANPVGSNVAGSSDAWRAGEPLHVTMDSYNNGLLCAPHRQ